ncbi:MAG: Gfo/Idh/MocA family oxidoreductase [Pirellulaceae bacterium]|nr:Gfo/Idh/MocA family oxidoreductase [Pirellulaceae bacterium]
MARNDRFSRRRFLGSLAGAAGAGLAAPYFVRAETLGLGGGVAPSERIVMASIGSGGKGRHNTGEFLKIPGVQFVAVCDVDRRHSAEDKKQVDTHYGNEDCRVYEDFRDLLGQEKLDALHVSTPDHWHALATVAAIRSGCDVYCEKPLANSVGESIAIRDAAREHSRIVQTGSQERANDRVRFAAELARSGRLGKIELIEVNMPCGDEWHHKEVLGFQGVPEPTPIPESLNWDLWLGPAAATDYHDRRSHFWWRFILAYGGGEMSDRGAHILDIAQLVLDMDESGPVEFKAMGRRNPENLYNAFMDYEFECTYANGVKIVGANREPRGLKIVGSEGSLFVHIHGGELNAEPASLLEQRDLGIDLGRSPGHHLDFINAVKSRQQPLAHAEIGCRTATLCHLLNVAMLVEAPVRWDPQQERVIDNPEAASLLMPKMREPWTL